MAPREGEDPGNVTRDDIVDFGEMLAKTEETGRFFFQVGLLKSNQLPIKSSHNWPNPFWESSRGTLEVGLKFGEGVGKWC